MSIKLLRWKSGAAGDTVLKLILDSDKSISSQVAYTNNENYRSNVDFIYQANFKYKEIASMIASCNRINETKLLNELVQLDNEDKNRNWILKTHAYINFPYPVIDITIDNQILPFAVTASLKKNFQDENIENNPWYDIDYNDLVRIIKDPVILYKYHCYNLAIDRMSIKNFNTKQIKLIDLLNGWDTFLHSIESAGLYVSARFEEYYNKWLDKNSIFFPSKEYTNLVETKNYDYTCTNLSLEERYCLLALSGEKFKILA